MGVSGSGRSCSPSGRSAKIIGLLDNQEGTNGAGRPPVTPSWAARVGAVGTCKWGRGAWPWALGVLMGGYVCHGVG